MLFFIVLLIAHSVQRSGNFVVRHRPTLISDKCAQTIIASPDAARWNRWYSERSFKCSFDSVWVAYLWRHDKIRSRRIFSNTQNNELTISQSKVTNLMISSGPSVTSNVRSSPAFLTARTTSRCVRSIILSPLTATIWSPACRGVKKYRTVNSSERSLV